MPKRMQISARGLVQGVGFRPFVYNLAKRFSLSGFVQNDTDGVLIDVEGNDDSVKEFLAYLLESPPPQAIIEDINCTTLPAVGYMNFIIKESAIKDSKEAMISADLATCPDCLKELFNPKDRRYRYPFINCTNCGPRFTIVKDIPYDRGKTTMSGFTMCPDCSKEYHDPTNRRFHAQPNACPVCGPELTLRVVSRESGVGSKDSGLKTQDPISTACALLNEGKIIAVKGLGGYHLACDAMNSEAVSTLRKRKYREDKPFAVMMENIETVRRFCHVNAKEETLLLSVRRPIVLLRKRSDCAIASEVAPKNKYLGVMLPYTPLHHLIIVGADGRSPLQLVMTSGNISDEPIAYNDKEAYVRLKGIADYFLVHNREIFMRCDDSVVRINEGGEIIVRRSRGYAPYPLRLEYTFERPILACGAFLKNTFCLARGNHAFLSHHIGDLENTETLHSFESAIEHYKKLFYIEPEAIAYDLHPEYLSTKYALANAECRMRNAESKKENILIPQSSIGVQHHHAHIASCMAENGINHKVIGVAFDGLGYGDDGNFWGSEFFVVDLSGYERVGHLDYVPMPGGEQAIKEPWRMAISYLYHVYGENIPLSDYIERLVHAKLSIFLKMLSQRINSPLTSSIGRLFDGVASILGLRHSINYEGQAAVELELIADEQITEYYPFDIDVIAGRGDPPGRPYTIICWQQIIEHVIEDTKRRTASSVISARFHNSIVEMVLQVCTMIRTSRCDLAGRPYNDVVLSGGVFQNNFIFTRLLEKLTLQGFKVYSHHKVPCNDGGISLGQAVIANERYKTCV
ncbi:MAG TPA: carbamoyltransferase HypF [Candidatus Brocadiia bacterium]|nr:carbamoyltransferase HypF [Candidatus Brocadiales bacterium]